MNPPPVWQDLYPLRSHYLTVGGHRYHYVDEGQGQPVLLVHGNPTWSFLWRDVITALRGRYRVVAVDHMGCGLSDRPRGYPYRLAKHIANLRSLVEHLGLQGTTLVGHDWGGAIGLGAAVGEPARYARIVLANTAAFRSRRMPLRIRLCRIPLLGRLAVQGGNAFVRAALRMAMEHPERLSAAARAGYLAPYRSWRQREAIYQFVKDIPLSSRHPSYETLAAIEERLPTLAHLPTLLMWGMRDWCFTPYFLERFLDFFPRAEVERFEDAGHWLTEDAGATATARLERFLEAHPSPAAAEVRR